MPLQCNIDACGKRVRFINGAVLLLMGALLTTFWAIPAGSWMAWVFSLLVLVVGAFVLFEACTGWCVARAMGFKTPI